MSRLSGKVCVITGAAGGIGGATAAAFEREGAQVVGVDLLEHAVGSLSLTADVTDESAVSDLYAQVRRELGPHALDAYTEVKSIFYATGA